MIATAVLQYTRAAAGTAFRLLSHEVERLLVLLLPLGFLASPCGGLLARLSFVESDVAGEAPAELALLASEDVAVVPGEEGTPLAVTGGTGVVLFVGFHEALGGLVEIPWIHVLAAQDDSYTPRRHRLLLVCIMLGELPDLRLHEYVLALRALQCAGIFVFDLGA